MRLDRSAMMGMMCMDEMCMCMMPHAEIGRLRTAF